MEASLENKIKNIKLLILDVDGVLTNGLIFYGSNNTEMRGFHIHDGLGIKLLQKMKVAVAIISAKQSESVMRRINDLHIQHYYLGHEHKLPAYEELKKKLELADHEVAYMGDDLPDLPLLARAAFAITVPEAPDVIKKQADYITIHQAGQGAVREVCELIMQVKDHDGYHAILQSYLN